MKRGRQVTKETVKKQSRNIEGVVTKVSGDKTVTILTERLKSHAKYQKVYTQSKKYLVHDEKNISKVGDKVIAVQSRPYSKRKRFALKKVISTAGEK